jgi:hypothetical protein
MASMTINGVKYEGTNISIVNGIVSIDGVVQDIDRLSGVVKVVVTGTLASLKTDGSVTCGTVEGNVNAGGSVSCCNVGGHVSAVGSVTCDKVGGSVQAGGSIRHGYFKFDDREIR